MTLPQSASNVEWSYKIYLERGGETKLKDPGLVDKRPFLVTLVDPFDIVDLLSGKYKRSEFWEEKWGRSGWFGEGGPSV
jgi:hypothetical protein